MFRPPSAQDISLDAEAERLGEARKVVGAPDKVLVDSLYAAETRHLPDGTDEVNYVRIRVTADEWRAVPAGLERKLMDLIREHWPVKDAGE